MAKGSPFPAAHKGLLDRTLSLFTDVRAGEGVGALLLATNVFYLLAFYQVLKIVRDALILSESGAVAASYASAGMALSCFVFVPGLRSTGVARQSRLADLRASRSSSRRIC